MKKIMDKYNILFVVFVIIVMMKWLIEVAIKQLNKRQLKNIIEFYYNRLRQKELIPMLYLTLKHKWDLFMMTVPQLMYGNNQDYDYDAAFLISNPELSANQLIRQLQNKYTGYIQPN